MANDSSFEADWHRYPFTSVHTDARRWIESCVMLGLASNTIVAYGRGIEGFLVFCQGQSIDVRRAWREVITQYVHHLRTQPRNGRANVICIDSGALLSNATLQQRLTAVRLFFEFLVEDELIKVNPVGRGRYTLSKRFGVRAERALVQRFHKLPWIPSEEQWTSLLKVVAMEPIRNRCMLALAYDAALRREELCQLRSDDLDPAHRLLRDHQGTSGESPSVFLCVR